METPRVCLTPKEVEKFYGISEAALSTDRCRKRGIPYVKRGRRVLYLREDVERYLRARRVLTIDALNDRQ